MRPHLFALALLFLFAVSERSAGQCTPDPVATGGIPGIYPDSLTGIPHATVGIPYSTVFQIKVPVDTTYLGLPAIIDSINVTGVTGLPSGFSYACNPGSCSFPGGSDGCFVLEGSAPTSGQIGSYPLIVNLMVYGRVLGVPQSLPSSNDNYTLYIDQNVGVSSLVPSGFFVSQNLPNPFGNTTEVIVGSPSADRITVTVADLLGNIVRNESYQVQKGQNRLQFRADDFSSGVYLYTITNGKQSYTRRMIVSGH
jgi:hypothetical protein